MSWSSLRPVGGAAPLIARIPGANDQPHTILANAGHFLQEDQPPQFAAVINSFIHTTS